MKTTLELPDDVMRAIRLRAAREDRTLKDVIAELLRVGLATSTQPARRSRSEFPVIEGRRPEGLPDDVLGPEAVARLLADADVAALAPVTSADE
ncbi:antitoxin [Piscicoccus intestinalis]|uniref:antitoxin n=1 Tax=Piscicoccus intestinalis TaxID=746033 RepID=UPI0012EE63CD|nr:antitoxin [Piscicoccus intestinalis]